MNEIGLALKLLQDEGLASDTTISCSVVYQITFYEDDGEGDVLVTIGDDCIDVVTLRTVPITEAMLRRIQRFETLIDKVGEITELIDEEISFPAS